MVTNTLTQSDTSNAPSHCCCRAPKPHAQHRHPRAHGQTLAWHRHSLPSVPLTMTMADECCAEAQLWLPRNFWPIVSGQMHVLHASPCHPSADRLGPGRQRHVSAGRRGRASIRGAGWVVESYPLGLRRPAPQQHNREMSVDRQYLHLTFSPGPQHGQVGRP